jgi:hypothetical protein
MKEIRRKKKLVHPHLPDTGIKRCAAGGENSKYMMTKEAKEIANRADIKRAGMRAKKHITLDEIVAGWLLVTSRN